MPAKWNVIREKIQAIKQVQFTVYTSLIIASQILLWAAVPRISSNRQDFSNYCFGHNCQKDLPNKYVCFEKERFC
jgi:hypothetical protein